MKINIVGTGMIVGEVLKMLHSDFKDRIMVTGILAREHSTEHAIDLCEEYARDAFVYTDLQRMLGETEADFVYIANANHVHYEYAMQAMQAAGGTTTSEGKGMNELSMAMRMRMFQ